MAGSGDNEGFKLGKDVATWALVGLNAAVYLAMALGGIGLFSANTLDVIVAGGVDPARVWRGDVWRLFTACFVHLGIWHIALNMWALAQVGRALESMIGGARVVLVYAASGVFGFAVSVSLTATPTAGASGAVCGVVGALLALALLVRRKRLGRLLFSALIPFVILTGAIGFFVPGIDNTAHAGGLVFGFLLAFGLSAGDRSFLADFDDAPADAASTPGASAPHRVGAYEGVLGTLALLVCGVLFAAVVVYAARPVLSPRYHAVTGLEDLLGKHVDDARAHAKAAGKLAPSDSATFVLLSRIAEESGDRAEGRRLAQEAIKRTQKDDTNEAFGAIVASLSLWGPSEELPFSDVKTANLVCDGALDAVASGASPALKNNCAWLKLKSTDPSVHDDKGALVLARAAVKESSTTEPDYASTVHTLANALAQNGDAAEGAALLEKLAAEGRGAQIPGGNAFLSSERKRLKRIAEAEDDVRSGER